MSEHIEIEIDERGVARLRLNRPQLHNAFDERMIEALTRALEELDRDPKIRVVVVAARGASFCAGADLNWMRRMADYTDDENVADALTLAALMRGLDGLSKPTVARVQGAAFGGGVGLCACCDIVVAGAGARFCLSEVRLGLLPAVIAPFVVRAMGPRAARRYFQTAAPFDAAEAQRIGLVHEVTVEDELDTRIDAIVADLLAGGPAAQAASKRLIARVTDAPIDDALMRDTAVAIARARASAEGREGLDAFLGKREPVWPND